MVENLSVINKSVQHQATVMCVKYSAQQYTSHETALQCMPQSLNNFSLRPYGLDDHVWAGITCKPITVHNALDTACCFSQIRGIATGTVWCDDSFTCFKIGQSEDFLWLLIPINCILHIELSFPRSVQLRR